MSAGAIIQLRAQGPQNFYVTGRPDFSYFKSVFRKHANFAMETVETVPQGPNELAIDAPIKLTLPLTRNGDFLTHVYFQFEVPDIYSGYNPDVSPENFESAGYRFAWVENLGSTIIQSCQLTIGGALINDLTGEWIRLWHELFAGADMQNFDEMTANLPEMFNPAFAIGASGTYPTSTLHPDLNVDPEGFSSSEYLRNPYLKPPSIRGRTITVPLNFYFSKEFHQALPLAAMQNHVAQIELTLRPLIELYTVHDNNESSATFGQRIRPSITEARHAITNFTTRKSPETFAEGDDLGDANGNYRGWGLRPRFLLNYAFVEEAERNQVRSSTHEFLIDQPQWVQFQGLTGNVTLPITVNSACKCMLWLAQRDDFIDKNLFSNYTNWENASVNPGSIAWIRSTIGESRQVFDDAGQPVVVDTPLEAMRNNTLPSKFNFLNFEREPVIEATLLFNGEPRFAQQSGTFFRDIQPYQHRVPCTVPGVNMLSFALAPTKFQPSGMCNFAALERFDLRLKFASVPDRYIAGEVVHAYKYNVRAYFLCTNVLRVVGGEATLAYSV